MTKEVKDCVDWAHSKENQGTWSKRNHDQPLVYDANELRKND